MTRMIRNVLICTTQVPFTTGGGESHVEGLRQALLAAGYNSNAAKLPGYLKRGGDGWRTLIPRETQMYLQIYKSFEGLVPLKTRAIAKS